MNGMNTRQMVDTVAAIKADKTLAHFEFRNRNQWISGGENRSTIRDFYGAGQEDRVAHRALRVHERRTAGAARGQRRCEPGGVPAARPRRLRDDDLRAATRPRAASRSAACRPASRATSTCRACSTWIRRARGLPPRSRSRWTSTRTARPRSWRTWWRSPSSTRPVANTISPPGAAEPGPRTPRVRPARRALAGSVDTSSTPDPPPSILLRKTQSC